MRQGQIHVVAAQHQMLAHGRARQQRQAAAWCCFHPDQRQVGGAAAHVQHQHQAAVLQLLGELRALQHQPIVKRGLGFFEQLHPGQAGQLRRLQRERARALVEGGGHRQHHQLLGQRRIGVRCIPGGAHMRQVAAGGLQRRDLGHILARAPGQYRRGAVHTGVRQPALGTGHQPPRHGRAEVTRPAADDGRGLLGCVLRRPGLAPGIAQLAGRGLVARGGQQWLLLHLGRRDALRQRQQRDVGHAAIQRYMGHHGVAGAQVYADGVARGRWLGRRGHGLRSAPTAPSSR